jgi:hypothetical protein
MKIKNSIDQLILKTELNDLAFRTLEKGIAYDADTGEIILEKDGNARAIYWTYNEAKRMDGTIFTHNHPNPQLNSKHRYRYSGLSVKDIDCAINFKFVQVRATQRWPNVILVYTMSPMNEWPSFDKFKMVYNECKDAVAKDFQAARDQGNITLWRAHFLYHHEVFNKVAQKLDLIYEKREFDREDISS